MRAEEELARTGRSQPFEKEYFRKDGSRVPVLVGSALFEGYGSGRTGASFVLDLTERKRAEADARDSERRYCELQAEIAHVNRVTSMGQITASIAHEMKQPIAATVLNATAALRWLGHRQPDLEEVRQGLARIVTDGNRAGEVLTRINDLVKKAPPRKDPVDVNAAIREVVELTKGEATKIGASMQFQLEEDLPLVEGDRVQLKQVALNLVINALQALETIADGARAVTISTRRLDSGEIAVAVEDTGPGLSADALEQVFKPFFTTKPGGLGVGLSICRSIVEAHGGQLRVAGNQPRGAVFRFTLPAPPGRPDDA
jgi:C4-dicarboxylate-specific signal transduction histidine kinase